QIWGNFQKWIDILSKIPNFYKFSDNRNPSFDILSFKIYNLKFELELLWGYTQQLRKAWWSEELAPVSTLDKLDEISASYFDEILVKFNDFNKTLPPEIFSYIEDTNIFLEFSPKFPPDEIYEKVKNRRDELLDHFHSASKLVWDYFYNLGKNIQQIKYSLFYLINQFNVGLESKQIVTVSEPYIRFGEKSGIMDQIYAVVNQVFLDYVGRYKERVLNKNNWKGLILPHSDIDYGILPASQILFLPFGFKFHSNEKLLLVAHEAVHFMLWNLRKDSNTYKEFKKKVWNPIFRGALNLVQELIDELIRNNYEYPHIMEQLKRIKKKLKFMIKTDNFFDSEILVDMITGLVAGPGYYKSLV
ncbi:MAG: hypothetical protein ACC656_14430, partial [Candidatus Heimdallarchaeota archaeon]